MDCLELGGETSPLMLLTHQAKIEKLHEIFAKNKYKSDLFLPDEHFYSDVVSVDDPERMANVLFKWLGIKHHSLTFHIDPNQGQLIAYNRTKKESKVTLGWPCLEDSLICGAAVAHAIVHHLLIARAKLLLGESEEDETLTDLGTIQTGFGILIINSLEDRAVLGSMAPANYTAEFLDYCQNQSIVDSVWLPFILPSITANFLQRPSASLKLSPFIKSRLNHSRIHKKKSILIVAIIVVSISGFILLFVDRPKPISAELKEKQDNIAVLRAEIDRCLETVRRKEETWDQTDMFILRQIDADKTRCTSLTSRYNYELRQYSSGL